MHVNNNYNSNNLILLFIRLFTCFFFLHSLQISAVQALLYTQDMRCGHFFSDCEWGSGCRMKL